ncbi:PREDICTED: protein SCAR1-like [Camelina sativa]|uniref:Protein SCAR n=1 Tax=Camelina sativa TaxID=90675 RepID=A0ABM0SND4_CAMSA|nr:PREDICTED: protein SCAR1-like [Camelina sativa]
MPLVRLQVRNVHGLGQPELHRNVDREDPKAILDGVSVSGLVGILRQLGDLTEFAAEIFHGIQEEVMITASRSNKLKMRLKQIEATVPSIHKKVLAQTNHIHFAYTGGLEWHPRIPNVQNHFIYDDLPPFIMAPYEDCREPPRLHLLDKFDINGPGSCLKRYSDPTHFKRASRASKLPEIKKKKSLQRNRDISSLASIANQSDRKTFTSLSFSGRTSCSKTASIESKSDLQDHRSFSFDSRSGGDKLKGVSSSSRFTPGSRTIASLLLSESESEDTNGSPSQDLAARVSWHEKAEIVEECNVLQCATDEAPEVIMKTNFVLDAEPVSRLNEHTTVDAELVSRLQDHTEFEAVQDIKPRRIEMDSEDETESEGDDFVDALYTIDSESENDQAYQTTEQVQKNVSNEITEERLDNIVCEQETEKITNNFSDDESICAAATELHLSSPVDKSQELIHQDPWAASEIGSGTHSYSNGFSNPLYDIIGIQEHQESEEAETSCDTESIKTWTNGNLLGLQPSKPKIVAETIPEIVEEIDTETFQEPLRECYKAPFDWFTSSPPLDHMKISFKSSETLPSSEMELKLPDDYTFSSFQLVPETTATSLPDSDSDKDTFCRSSSYISDNSDNDDRSVSMSEQQWEEESEKIRESKNQQELYDSFNRTNREDSSLSAPSPKIETASACLVGNVSYLQNPAEPLPPPLPPLQWMVSKIPSSERFEDNNKTSLKDALMRAFEQNNKSLHAVKKEESNIVTVSDPKPEIKVNLKNSVRDYKQIHGNAKETEAGDFLHQIRTKQFNLRRVVTTKTASSEATMNTNISVILEKANSIRQAVASDDGDDESDSWSDSDT